MLNEKMQALLVNGELPANAWPGLTPLYYYDDSWLVLCPACANRHEEFSGIVIEQQANDEDPHLYCDHCYKPIPAGCLSDDEAVTEREATRQSDDTDAYWKYHRHLAHEAMKAKQASI